MDSDSSSHGATSSTRGATSATARGAVSSRAASTQRAGRAGKSTGAVVTVSDTSDDSGHGGGSRRGSISAPSAAAALAAGGSVVSTADHSLSSAASIGRRGGGPTCWLGRSTLPWAAAPPRTLLSDRQPRTLGTGPGHAWRGGRGPTDAGQPGSGGIPYTPPLSAPRHMIVGYFSPNETLINFLCSDPAK